MHLTQFVALFDCLSEDYLLLQKVVDKFIVFLKRQTLGQEKNLSYLPGVGVGYHQQDWDQGIGLFFAYYSCCIRAY